MQQLFVSTTLEALRERWWQGDLIVDAHIFTEHGIVVVDALNAGEALAGGGVGGMSRSEIGGGAEGAAGTGDTACLKSVEDGEGGEGGEGVTGVANTRKDSFARKDSLRAGKAMKFAPEGSVGISGRGRQDLSVAMLGNTVGPLPPGAWARLADVC